MNAAAARLAFFGMAEAEAAPRPSPARARVDAAASDNAPADPGPSRQHRNHGAIRLAAGGQLRVTTQRPTITKSGKPLPARLVVRRWFQSHAGRWWPAKDSPGIAVSAEDAKQFLRAIQDAVDSLDRNGEIPRLAGEAKP